MKAKQYFDKKAEGYQKERTHGLIGNLVANEQSIVMNLLSPKEGEKILDAGCGSGFYSSLIRDYGASVFGIDFSPAMITELGKKGIPGEVADIEHLNLGKKFDKILCAGALEFTRMHQDVFRNFSEHLKEGGCFVLVYPRKSFGGVIYQLFHLSHGVKIKLFSKKELKNLALKAGLILSTVKKGDTICNIALFSKNSSLT